MHEYQSGAKKHNLMHPFTGGGGQSLDADDDHANAGPAQEGVDDKRRAPAAKKLKIAAKGTVSTGKDWMPWQSLFDLSDSDPMDAPYLSNSKVDSEAGILKMVGAAEKDDPSFASWSTAGSTFLYKDLRFVTITTEGDDKEFMAWLTKQEKKRESKGKRKSSDMDNLTLYNHVPTRLQDTPKHIFIEPGKEPPFTRRPPALMITGLFKHTNHRKCDLHPKGCGLHLKSGDLVLVDGRTFKFQGNGMYTAMCFKLVLGKRSCVVGFVRSHYSQVGHVANFVGMVGYISPQPTGDEKPFNPKSRAPKYDRNVFNKTVGGFAHLYDVNMVSHMQPGENDKKALLCDGMKELPTMEVILGRTNNRTSTELDEKPKEQKAGKKRKKMDDADQHSSSASTSSPGEAS